MADAMPRFAETGAFPQSGQLAARRTYTRRAEDGYGARLSSLDALPLDVTALEEDLRQALDAVDLSGTEPAVSLWRSFLAHASKPLAYGSRFSDDPDNDQLEFWVRLSSPEAVVAYMERRIGVVDTGSYQGTIVVECRIELQRGDAWHTVDASRAVSGYGPTANGLPAFCEEVENSPVFRAMARSAVTKVMPIAHFA